ncbi:MAG: NUDIX domain-containing protein [Bacteroidia bacterium]|jgi:8-oxo-dGTP pyrophosphatase MutT (NUDIX family)|nr:NUDIX domain-containing protein [Bacteroidia bacterium]
MPQKYTVYLNGKALFFNKVQDSSIRNIPGKDYSALNQALEELRQTDFVSLPDILPEEGLAMLKQRFQFIRAAGGVVESPSSRILLIYRLDTWDLPKGKIDPGESEIEAAIREIEEETGIVTTQPVAAICRTWHIYKHNSSEILKETSWFHFKVASESSPIIQTEEHISHAGWYNLDQIKQEQMQNMYPSIRDVIQTFSANL